MSNNRDDQKKDPLRQGEPKRPHATLDLKAVEIKTQEQKAAENKAAATAAASSASSSSPTKSGQPDIKPETKPGTSSADPKVVKAAETAAKDVKEELAKQQTAANVGPGKSSGAPPSGKIPPPAAPRSGGGTFGRLVSHTIAGLVGGFLALLGADTIAPQLGLPSRSVSNEAAEQIKSRLAALETASKSAPTLDSAKLTGDIAAASARLAKLEELQQRVADLSQGQDQLKAETHQLATKIADAPQAAGSASDPRIAKLEEQLSLISSASSNGKASSALPQLAAVTGKIADLESTMSNQLAALRQNVSQDIEQRMSKAAESAEAARSGTQRIDREMADVKTDAARLGQRMEALKADNERVTETLRVVQEETGKLTSGLDTLKGDLAARFKSAAKPDDIASAIAPVASKVATLEKNVESVVTAEQDRKTNAERIVLSLELANLKRVIDRGLGYSEELSQVKKAAGGKIDLAALETYKTEGVPTLPELQSSFRPLTHRMIDAAESDGDGGVLDRLLSEAKSVVRVRKVKHSPGDDSVEAVVARMDTAIGEGRIGDFQALAEKLPEKSRSAAADFFKKVDARHAVDKALKEIESQLKSSLGGVAAPAGN